MIINRTCVNFTSTTFNKGFSDTFFLDHLQYNLEHEVNDLDPADEREACEEPHGASYSRQLVHKLGCSVLQNVVKKLPYLILPILPFLPF